MAAEQGRPSERLPVSKRPGTLKKPSKRASNRSKSPPAKAPPSCAPLLIRKHHVKKTKKEEATPVRKGSLRRGRRGQRRFPSPPNKIRRTESKKGKPLYFEMKPDENIASGKGVTMNANAKNKKGILKTLPPSTERIAGL